MPRKFFRKYLPDPDEVLARRWAAPFRPWLGHPNLWCLNRRSVSGAVAIGLFCGLIPGPFQMLGALLLAIPLRRNIPVALVVTFYTNPFTIVPLYLIAFAYGRAIMGGGDAAAPMAPSGWDFTSLWQWMTGLGKPLGVGLVALAVTLAVLGYFAVELAWRAHVVAAWRRRAQRRGK
jgi:uncharacterized protein (DUF2062 family)